MSALELAGRRVLVVGLARSGKAAAEALRARGAAVVGFDRDETLDVGRLGELGVEVHLGAEEETLLQGIDLVVKSPGVPGETVLVERARTRGVPVWSEIELGARLLPNPILGVTGTNGKTTTAELLGAVFRAAGRNVEVAGNVGRPLTSLVGSASTDAWVVCELSSFQLEDVHTLKPRVAVLLNLEPDHLDRHGTFEQYAELKLRIFERQGAADTAVVPRGFGAVPGNGTRVEFAADDTLPAEPRIPGRHNRENSAAATAAARAVGIDDEAIAEALSSFEGVVASHRARPRGRWRAVRERLQGDERRGGAPCARVLPGRTAARDSRRTRKARVLRAARRRIRSRRPGVPHRRGGDGDRSRASMQTGVDYIVASDLGAALAEAASAASAGDVVLLSPACASFDQFRDFEARGDAFRELVESLAEGPRGVVVLKGDGYADQRLVAFLTLGLVAFGLVMVYSATSASAALGNGDPMSFLKRQAVYAFIGVVLMTLAARFDYHRLRYIAPPLVLVALVLCAAVLVLGPAINGARRWFIVGPASFQPSELAKLALCLFAATYLARRRAPRTFGELMKPLGALTLIFGGLIVIEPDLGTTITLCGMMLAIFLVAGVPVRLLVGRVHPRRRDSASSRSGSSRTGARASSASSTRGRMRRDRAFRSSRRRSGSARGASRAPASARASGRSRTCPRRTRT